MNHYGEIARNHWARWLPARYAQIQDPEAFAEQWRARASEWNFGAVNELIRQHNEWYPIERNLPLEHFDLHVVFTGARQAGSAGIKAFLKRHALPRDATVFPPIVAVYLLEKATALGAVLFQGRTVTHLGQGEARFADGGRITSPRLVNAAGADAPFCTPGLPIRKRKGHLAITDRYPGLLHHQIVELGYMKSAHSVPADSVACNLQPRVTRQILIGSARQFGDLDNPNDPVTQIVQSGIAQPLMAHLGTHPNVYYIDQVKGRG